MEQNQLMTIADLGGKNFEIPSYQRGYRWGEREVQTLLQDILEFAQNDDQSNFYCLQPIVVKKSGEKYRVIDGQQRLTTIFLIIKFLEGKDYFGITYQSRKDSANFLQNIQSEVKKKNTENIDFYHFSEAYKIIEEFFDEKKDDRAIFKETLLDKCKVLWYEIAENENEVFIRLNIGKIPLVEAENIKALFLSKDDKIGEDDLKERAERWYQSEIDLREDRDFKYCVLNKVDTKKDIEDKNLKDDVLRIEAFLKAIVPHKKCDNYLFDHFYESYKKGKIGDEWEKLEDAINNLSSFASKSSREKINREIFHYLGLLILSDSNIYDLYKEWKDNGKSQEKFAQKLLLLVQKKFSRDIEKIDRLDYNENEDREKIKNLLLLFNLEYLIREQSSDEYFKFNRFVLEEWSLEHIYAQNSKSIRKTQNGQDDDCTIEWLKELLLYVEDEPLCRDIERSIEQKKFNKELFEKIDDNFKNNEALHTIQNLTLLDKESNSKIGNQIFSQKRKAIQKLAEEDKLIPIATRKVFEKVFSENKSNPDVFERKDQEDYLSSIKEYLQRYAQRRIDEF